MLGTAAIGEFALGQDDEAGVTWATSAAQEVEIWSTRPQEAEVWTPATVEPEPWN